MTQQLKTNPSEFKKWYENVPLDVRENLILIPIVKNGKFPDVKKGESWVNNTITYKEALERLNNGLNVGVVGNGIPSGYVIVDIDSYKMTSENLKKFLAHFPPTLSVKTPRGGLHLYYKAHGFFMNGIAHPPFDGELRARNYYVVAPGSYVSTVDKNGKTYEGNYKLDKIVDMSELAYPDITELFKPISFVNEIIKSARIDIPKEKINSFSDVKNKWGHTLDTILAVSPKLLLLLTSPSKSKDEANSKGYASLSEEDFATISALKFWEFSKEDIFKILVTYRERDKFYKHKDYLERSYNRCVPKTTISDVYNMSDWTPINITPIIERKAFDFITLGNIETVVNKIPSSNLVRKYYDHMTKRTDAYREYLFFSALQTMSVIANREIVLGVTPFEVSMKLWGLLLGTSTISRKSTTIHLHNRILSGTSLGKMIYKPKSFSTEGFLSKIGVKIKKDEEVEDIPSARWHLLFEEFGGFLSTISKEYNADARDILMSLYDDSPAGSMMERDLASSKIVIKDDYITIFGATTPSALTEKIKNSDIFSGFIPRFVIIFPVYDKEKKKLSEIDSKISKEEWDLSAEFDKLRSNIVSISYKLKDEMRQPYIIFVPSQKSWDLYYDIEEKMDKFIDELDETERNLLISIVNRYKSVVLRIAGLLFMGSKEFRDSLNDWVKGYKEGDAFTKYNISNVAKFEIPEIYMEISGKFMMELLLNYLKIFSSEIMAIANNSFIEKAYYTIKRYCLSHNMHLVSKSYILKQTHFSSQQLNSALMTLRERGDIILLTKDNKAYVELLR